MTCITFITLYIYFLKLKLVKSKDDHYYSDVNFRPVFSSWRQDVAAVPDPLLSVVGVLSELLCHRPNGNLSDPALK